MANKFSNYMFLMGGMLLIFYFLGLVDGGLTGSFLDLLLSPEDVKTSSLVVSVSAIIGGVLIGFGALRLVGFTADMALLAGMIAPLLGFGWDFLLLYQTVYRVSDVFAILFFSPLIVVYVLTVVEWWRGVST